MCVQRKTWESSRQVQRLPRIGGRRVQFHSLIVAVPRFIETGCRENSAIARCDQGRIPAAMLHVLHECPGFVEGIEDADLFAAFEGVVTQRATGRQHTAIR